MHKRISLILVAVLAFAAAPADAKTRVAEFKGTGDSTTAIFRVESPWILDWRLDGDFDQLVGLEITLIEAKNSRHVGRVPGHPGRRDHPGRLAAPAAPADPSARRPHADPRRIDQDPAGGRGRRQPLRHRLRSVRRSARKSGVPGLTRDLAPTGCTMAVEIPVQARDRARLPPGRAFLRRPTARTPIRRASAFLHCR